MELNQTNTVLPAWSSKVIQPYTQDQLKPQRPQGFGTQRNFKQNAPFTPLPIVNNYYRCNFQLERLFNQPLAK
jgi:hypothetical protein